MNDKIANWILSGRLPKDLNDAERMAYGVFTYRDNKPVDDTDAVALLPVLANKKYTVQIDTTQDGTFVRIIGKSRLASYVSPKFSEAIIGALLLLIGREAS